MGFADAGAEGRNQRVSPQPVVVIVGRPNVGKSTLFNRLTRSRRALVHDLPGVTRDRIFGEAQIPGGRTCTVVDTGGLLLDDEDRWIPLIRSQAMAAVDTADVVLLVLDGDAGPIPEDVEIAELLRRRDVPVVVVVNKADRSGVELQAEEFHRLGLGSPIAVSAEHGMGIAELWDAIEAHLGRAADEVADTDDEPGADEVRVTIIGRPNVGKSSLLNRLLGDERVLVSEVPGTTRDAVDVVLEHGGQRFRFVDTAGIRRKGRTDTGPEVLSVVQARRSLERAQLCLVVIDATEGVTRQDAHVAGYAWEAGRAIAVVINKWDLIEERADAARRMAESVDRELAFARSAPRVFVSALTGRGVGRIFPALTELHGAYLRRPSTSELNRVLRAAWQSRPPSARGRREPRLYYASQLRHPPPSFLLFTNQTDPLHFSYQRYLENSLRDSLGLAGVPIRVMIRGRDS